MNEANVTLTFTQLSFFFNAPIGNWGLNLPEYSPTNDLL